MVIGVLIIIGAVAAFYYTAVGGTSSQGSEVSSLRSVVSSLNQAVTSQASEIQSLQSQQTTTGSTTTITVTSSAAGSITTTVTSTRNYTVTSTVTSHVTATVTTVSTTTLTSTTILVPGNVDTASLSGTLTIPGGNGSGMLTLTVANTGNDPIIAINVAVPSGPDPTMDLCSSTCSLVLSYNGNQVTSTNPLLGENYVTGALSTNEGQTGTGYSLSVTIIFADQTMQALSLSLSAQA